MEPLRAFFSESKCNGLCKNSNEYLFARCVIRLRVWRSRTRASTPGGGKIFYLFQNLKDGLQGPTQLPIPEAPGGLGRNGRDVQVSVQRHLEPKLRFHEAIFPFTNMSSWRAKRQFHRLTIVYWMRWKFIWQELMAYLKSRLMKGLKFMEIYNI